MVKNRRLAQKILDASWGKFLQLLAYKAESADKVVVKVNPRGTSQEYHFVVRAGTARSACGANPSTLCLLLGGRHRASVCYEAGSSLRKWGVVHQMHSYLIILRATDI